MSANYVKLDDGCPAEIDTMNPDEVRDQLVVTNTKAVAKLCYSALEHASDGMTNMDQKLVKLFVKACGTSAEDCDEMRKQAQQLFADVKDWIKGNPAKVTLLVLGMGGSAYKAKTIGDAMQDQAQTFIDWGKSSSAPMRFLGFVGLMNVRLIVSTLVPPTSPAFGIILQAATPASQKWTAMPFFLAASTVAGATPWLLDKLAELVSDEDFGFTFLAKRFTDNWPLTCWTAPATRKVFQTMGGGATGASFAVVFAHAAPFMGAQTTITQRYFLPHPLDAIISQPFGMSEDLVSMAMAEAASNPTLGSASLTLLVVCFNLMQFFLFAEHRDLKAMSCALANLLVGLYFAYSMDAESNATVLVILQLFVQALVIPATSSVVNYCLDRRVGSVAGANDAKGLCGERDHSADQKTGPLIPV